MKHLTDTMHLKINRLKHSYDTDANIRNYFLDCKRNPHNFELILIDAVWNSHSISDINIEQVEFSSENPHIFAALRQYRLFERELGVKITSLNNIIKSCPQYSKNCSSTRHRTAVISFVAENDSVLDYALSVFVDAQDSLSHADFAYSSVSKLISNNASTVCILKTDSSLETESTTKSYTLSVHTLESQLLSNVDNLSNTRMPNAAFSLGVLDLRRKIKEFAIGDSIILARATGSALARSNLFKNLLSNTAAEVSLKISIINKDSIIEKLLSIGSEFGILIDKFHEKPDLLISHPSTDTMIIVVKKSWTKTLVSLSTETLEILEIGRLIRSKSLLVKKHGIYYAKLDLSFLIHKKNSRTTAFINDKLYKSEIKSLSDFKSDLVKSLKETSQITNNPLDTSKKEFAFAPFFGNQLIEPYSVVGFDMSKISSDCLALIGTSQISGTNHSPFTTAIDNCIVALSKIISRGASLANVGLSFNTFYPKESNCSFLGDLLSTTLGFHYISTLLKVPILASNFSAQNNCTALHTTVVSVGTSSIEKTITQFFNKQDRLYLLHIARDEYSIADFKYLFKLYSLININIERGKISAASVVTSNIIDAIVKSLRLNNLGFSFVTLNPQLLKYKLGDIIISTKDITRFDSIEYEFLGIVDDSGIIRSSDIDSEEDFSLQYPSMNPAQKPDFSANPLLSTSELKRGPFSISLY
ncbi:MAG: hypothetical protein LBU04_00925 [Christensenellaceae bacterium]|jgi:hypothetical protein|nr:hypothetical protein [Christensenellaceae bacterium]